MISSLIAFIAAAISGIVTGITPGLHVNLVSAIVSSSAQALSAWFSPIDLAVFIVVMATVHTFLDVIPSVFLGAPSEGFAIAPLPGHRLLLAGAGYEAARIATAGGLVCAVVAIIASPLLWLIVPVLADILSPWMGWILVIVTALFIVREDGIQAKARAVLAVVSASIIGLLALRGLSLDEPLLPLLSGLFGASSLIIAFGEENAMPRQFITEMISISAGRQALLVACAVVSGWIVSFLPGVGTAQAAILSTALLPALLPHEYLYLIGGIGSVNFILSIVSMGTIAKARNGAIAAVMGILPAPTIHSAAILILASLAAAGIGAFLALLAARSAVRIMSYIPYRLSCAAVLLFVSAIVAVRTGGVGCIVFATAASLGILALSYNVARVHLMACLTVPVIIYLFRL